MSYSYGNYFSNGNPKSLNECFWAKDYAESNSSRHDVWWIAFYSGPDVNGNPRITLSINSTDGKLRILEISTVVFHVCFVTIGSGFSKRITLHGVALISFRTTMTTVIEILNNQPR